MISISILFWLACSALTYAMNFADFQKSFPLIAEKYYRQDMAHSVAFGLILGPIGLIVVFFTSGFAEHGLKWK
jgi:hypothetical protein